jgi:hypothetical protein
MVSELYRHLVASTFILASRTPPLPDPGELAYLSHVLHGEGLFLGLYQR